MWIDAVNLDDIDLQMIEITDANFFGQMNGLHTDPNKLGFLKFTATAFNRHTGKPMDGIVFLRGPCATILIIVTDETDKKYVLVGNQARLPVGDYISEFIAGMFDENSGAKVNAVMKKEIKEETGLELLDNDPNMKSLGKPIILSGGGSDEKAHMLVWNTVINSQKIAEMKEKEFGEHGTNESIRLRFYEYDTFENELENIGDAKTEVAWYRYMKQINTIQVDANSSKSCDSSDLSDEPELITPKLNRNSWFSVNKN